MEVSQVDTHPLVRRGGGVGHGASGLCCFGRVSSPAVARRARHLRRYLGHGGCAVGHQRAGIRQVGIRPACHAHADAQAWAAASARGARRARRRAVGVAAVAIQRHELSDARVAMECLEPMQRRHVGRLWIPVEDLRPTGGRWRRSLLRGRLRRSVRVHLSYARCRARRRRRRRHPSRILRTRLPHLWPWPRGRRCLDALPAA